MKYCLEEVNSKRVQIYCNYSFRNLVQNWQAVIFEFPFIREIRGRFISYVCAKLLCSKRRQLMRWQFSNNANILIPCGVMKSLSGVSKLLKLLSLQKFYSAMPSKNIYIYYLFFLPNYKKTLVNVLRLNFLSHLYFNISLSQLCTIYIHTQLVNVIRKVRNRERLELHWCMPLLVQV